ncbi:MAG: hypothetical protein ACLFVK_08485 [Dehalococcoidia bacterium]
MEVQYFLLSLIIHIEVFDVRKDRLIIGIICLALAVQIFLVGTTGGTVAPAIALAILGIWGIATAKKEIGNCSYQLSAGLGC